jgi:hypothetical protein
LAQLAETSKLVATLNHESKHDRKEVVNVGRQVMNLVLIFVLGLTVLISPGATMATSELPTAREKNPGLGEEQPDIVRQTSDTPSGTAMNCNPTDTEPSDTLTGNEPSDNLTGNEPSDNLTGNEPSDTLTGTEPSDNPTGTEPSDTLTGTEPSDNPTGTEPSDTLTGNEPSDNLAGTEPSDNPTDTEASDNTSGNMMGCPPSENELSDLSASDGIDSAFGASRMFTYTYNARNQLQYLYENGVLKIEFIYDNNGNLIRKKVYEN